MRIKLPHIFLRLLKAPKYFFSSYAHRQGKKHKLKTFFKVFLRFISQMRNFPCLTVRRCFMTIAVLGCNHLRDFINYSYFMTPCQFPCLRKKRTWCGRRWKNLWSGVSPWNFFTLIVLNLFTHHWLILCCWRQAREREKNGVYKKVVTIKVVVLTSTNFYS